MQVEMRREGGDLLFYLYKEKQRVGFCRAREEEEDINLVGFEISPQWQSRGYGSFFLKKVLALTGGFDRDKESCHRIVSPGQEAGRALCRKYGFLPPAGGEEGAWVRLRRPELSAVAFVQQNLSRWLKPGGFFIDATCGNGHDTVFLCRLAGPSGRVLGLDIQPQAVEAANRRLHQEGLEKIGRAVQADHARLADWALPASADCVVFNFGYLPGADHRLFTRPASSLPALEAALEILRPGGVLSACLYSGGVNGDEEKKAVTAYLEALPPERYTVLICRFANRPDTAPLPCFVLKH